MSRARGWIAPVVSALVLCACGGADEGSSEPANLGSGGSGGGDIDFDAGVGQGGSGQGGNGYCGTSLTGTLRDFQQSHPDFEFIIEVDPGIVLPVLGTDGKPVYAGAAGNPTTHSQADFDQWYRDVPGINLDSLFTVDLTDSGGGVYTYDNSSFFPLDGQGFGDEGHPHNYHFTFELRTRFQYNGGEVFKFTGDDDLFVFINGQLAIDLGGVHGALSQEIDLDARASELGIVPGNIYPLDFFFAERHTTESNFRIDTTIGSFVDCGPTPK